MEDDRRVAEAIDLMMAFAERTGVTSDREPRRYLWTDAFAVCNLVGLARLTGDGRHAQLARRLVDQVHRTLGQHRADDTRRGWLSGLDEARGAQHPTAGGLRIGKPLPERRPGERYDDRLEWDRDGQYFHYLTKWMHALDVMARATREPTFNLWARELAETAARAFIQTPGGVGPPRMVWKMSIDLSRALVPSMGQHDPLDGYVTALQLRATASETTAEPEGPDLTGEVERFARMLEQTGLVTADPLGIGGLLMDASRLDSLAREGHASAPELLESLLAAAFWGLQAYLGSNDLDRSAGRRLAFRELGLAIGLSAVERMHRAAEGDQERPGMAPETRAHLDKLMPLVPIGARIVEFWMDSAHRAAPTWAEHRDINEVMLATALAPDGCLSLVPVAGGQD